MSSRKVVLALSVMLALIAGLVQPQAVGVKASSSIIYVKWDASGANNGSSWANAYTDLQAALAAAITNDQVWVAAGRYTPAPYTAPIPPDRTLSFVMKEGVKLYGGFTGIETSLTERNWTANVTILSGDLKSDDAGFENNSDNSYHVVNNLTSSLSSLAVLDGFTISGGNANGTDFLTGSGGGMFNWNSSPTLAHLIFYGNTATVSNGEPFGLGGGLLNTNSSSPTLTDVTFLGNLATNGGGMYNVTGSSPSLSGVIFSGNWAESGGGGIGNVNSSSPTLVNVLFHDNTAAMGGGLYNNNASSPKLFQVTFGNNTAEQGFEIYNSVSSKPATANSILWSNQTGTSSPVYSDGSSIPTIQYSLVQGGWSGAGANNRSWDPLFVDLDGGDLRLYSASPAVNQGSSGLVPAAATTDLNGSPRIVGTAVDMGAYEHQLPNQAPTLTGSYALPDIDEDPSSNPGVQVSAFLNGAGVSDPEAAALGMAVTGADNTHGQWQWWQTAPGGGSWKNFGSESDAAALLLAADTAVHFVPNADWNGSAKLTFRAWDGADGRAVGATGVSLSFNGSNSAFSSGSAELTQVVAAVNDPPVNTALPAISGTLKVAQVLTASTGSWTDEKDQLAALIGFAYQWQSADDSSGTSLADIGGATTGSYTPMTVGWLRVKVTATDNGVPGTASAPANSAWVQIVSTDQTITFDALSNKTYGDADFNLSATASSGLTVTFAVKSGSCSLAGAATVHITGAGSCTITASQAGNANYNPAVPVDQTFSIEKAANSLTFDPLTGKTIDDPDFTVSATATSGLAVNFSAAGPCQVLNTNTIHLTGEGGTCTITASQPGDDNYLAAAPVSRSFIVLSNHAPQVQAVADQSLDATTSLALTILASDPLDAPPNTIHFALVNPPSGALINSATGALTWTPTRQQAGSTYTLTVRVGDDGIPLRYQDLSFKVTVRVVNDLSLGLQVDRDPALTNTVLYYRLKITNLDDAEGTGLVLNAALPSGLTFLVTQSDAACTALNAQVTCRVAQIAAGGQVSLLVGALVSREAAEGAELLLTASLAADQNDLKPENNTGALSVTVTRRLVVYDSSSEGAGVGWSDARTATTPAGESFFGRFNNQEVSKTLTGMPYTQAGDLRAAAAANSDTQVEISFDLFIIDSWDGSQSLYGPDIWEFEAQHKLLVHTTFTNWENAYQAYPFSYPGGEFLRFTNAIRHSDMGYLYRTHTDMNAVYHFRFVLPNSGPILVLSFRDLGLQELEDESWGLKNVKVSVLGSYISHQIYIPALQNQSH